MTERNTAPREPVGARPIGAPAKKRPAWLIPLLLLLLVVLLLLLLSRCGGDDDPSSTTATATPSTTSTTAGPSATTAGPSDTSSAIDATAAADAGASGASGTIVADGTPLLPLVDATEIGADGDLSAYAGDEATATAISVQSVPADEGFWVGASAGDRVWIQLTGQDGESPFTVKKGDSVSFTGEVTKNDSGFAQNAGVTDAEGKKLLTSQGQHISVAKSALKLAP